MSWVWPSFVLSLALEAITAALSKIGKSIMFFMEKIDESVFKRSMGRSFEMLEELSHWLG